LAVKYVRQRLILFIDITFKSSSGRIVTRRMPLAEHLARAANDVTDAVAAALAAFAAEEASEDREEAVLSCSSTTEAVGLPVLMSFLLIVVGGWPHGIHFHRTPGLFNSHLRLVLHI